MESSLLRISRICVNSLYGLYDHDVPLNMHDRMTIIHGPNGVGKTALLRLVEALVQGKYFELARVTFQSFSLDLSDGSVLGVREKAGPETQNVRQQEPDVENKRPELEVFFAPVNGDEQTQPLHPQRFDSSRLLKQIDIELPWIGRIGQDQWMDHRTDTVYNSEEIISNFADMLPPRIRKKIFAEPEWLASIRARVSVHLIETQRLLRIGSVSRRNWNSNDAVVSIVQNYAKELHVSIAEALANYGKTSQSLDQSFPQRLLSGNMHPLSSDDLKQQMGELENGRAKLKRIGLLDDDRGYPFDVATLDRADETQKKVMTLYVEDTASKLSVLDGLAARVILLLDSVNKKFRNKTLSIDKNRGLIATDSNGRALDLDSLSSGEQHELVLMYDLLFRVRPNTLVLIDEPELSLHLIWQKTFLADLAQIVSTVKFDVLLATHSPFIAGDREDLMIDLASEKSQ